MSGISGLPRDGTYTIIHLPPQPQPEEREDSQESLTDEKIRKLRCEICLEHKIPEEIQTIPHKSYLQNTITTQRKCRANEEPLFCRKCVVQLKIPKKCPLCRDKLNIPSENAPIAIQPQPVLIAQNPQGYVINIIINVQNPNPVQRRQNCYITLAKTCKILAAAGILCCFGGIIGTFIWYESHN
jgi:hypothetical protein